MCTQPPVVYLLYSNSIEKFTGTKPHKMGKLQSNMVSALRTFSSTTNCVRRLMLEGKKKRYDIIRFVVVVQFRIRLNGWNGDTNDGRLCECVWMWNNLSTSDPWSAMNHSQLCEPFNISIWQWTRSRSGKYIRELINDEWMGGVCVCVIRTYGEPIGDDVCGNLVTLTVSFAVHLIK